MRWSLGFVVALALMAREAAAFAQLSETHLTPETGTYGSPSWSTDYDRLVRKLLSDDNRHWAELVVLPSFGAEEIVSIQGPDVGTAQVVHAKAKRSIWTATGLGSTDPKQRAASIDAVSVPVERHSAKLNAELQTRLLRAWVAFLRATQYGPFTGVGDDGTSYHFSAFLMKRGIVAGWTWEPPKDSVPTLFVEIGTLLAQFADAADATRPTIATNLEKKVRRAEWFLGLTSATGP
jgi:hypothetical protein